jgi:hypothetical protein
MIQKLRDSSKTLANDFIEDARKYSDSSKEQVKFIEDQIRLIAKRNSLDKESAKLRAQLEFKEVAARPGATPASIEAERTKLTGQLADIDTDGQSSDLQVKLLQEIVEAIKVTSKQEIVDNKQSVLENIQEVNRLISGGDYVDPEEFLKTRIQENILNPPLNEDRGGGPGFFASTIGAGLLRDVGAGVSAIPSAANELDLIAPLVKGGAGLLGAGLGTAAGTVPEALSLGQIEYATIGAEIGKQIGSFVSEGIIRSEKERSRLFGATASLRGLTGGNVDIGATQTTLGLDVVEQTQLIEQVVRASGRVSGAAEGAVDVATLEKGLSLSRSDILKQFELSRLTGEDDTFSEVASLLISLKEEGIITKEDRALFGEILSNQSSLVSQFSLVSENPDRQRATDIIKQFDRVGGVFGAKDPRSSEIIQGISSAISGTEDDFGKAAILSTIRQLPGFEDASLLDLEIAKEKGLETPGVLEGILDQAASYGDAGVFGANELLNIGSLESTKKLIEGRDKLKGLEGEDRLNAIEEITGEKIEIGEDAEENVSRLSRQTAEVTNAFIESMSSGVTAVAKLFEDAMGTAINNLVKDKIDSFSEKDSKIPKQAPKPTEADIAAGFGYRVEDN